MDLYDPYFASDAAPLERTYDFITCTETVEHFYQPAKEFQRFDRLLRCDGWLGIMTEMLESDEDFVDWWYHSEPTHVCFYKRETMAWIASPIRLESRISTKECHTVLQTRKTV